MKQVDGLHAVLDLAEQELQARRPLAAAAVIQIAHDHAPDDPAVQRLRAAAALSPPDSGEGPCPPESIHLARARAYHLLGRLSSAESEIESALSCNADLPAVQFFLSSIRLPGDDYYSWLRRFHGWLAPKNYLEIGVLNGESLCLAQPPTRAIGVDPSPSVVRPLSTETHLFCQKSDAFFASGRLGALLQDQPLQLAFIDGSHLLEAVLTDFMHVEAHCEPNALILLHDTIPLNDVTQRRQRTTAFYTGDVWKAVLCLRHYRPDLEIFTIAAPPTGLTAISRLNPLSRVIAEHHDEIVARFVDLQYSQLQPSLGIALNVIANDWQLVEARLRACGIHS